MYIEITEHNQLQPSIILYTNIYLNNSVLVFILHSQRGKDDILYTFTQVKLYTK